MASSARASVVIGLRGQLGQRPAREHGMRDADDEAAEAAALLPQCRSAREGSFGESTPTLALGSVAGPLRDDRRANRTLGHVVGGVHSLVVQEGPDRLLGLKDAPPDLRRFRGRGSALQSSSNWIMGALILRAQRCGAGRSIS